MNTLPRVISLGDSGPCIVFDRSWLTQSIANRMRTLRGAAMDYMQAMTPNGSAYKSFCRGYHSGTGTMILFSRDEGMHSNGWWKNPDYERCLHLSLSFYEIDASGTPLSPRPKDEALSARWVDAFFGDDKKLLWCEPPYSREGKRSDVWHYRLFVDKAWRPIKPRGEVYTREFTDAGWKSYSDVQHALRTAVQG